MTRTYTPTTLGAGRYRLATMRHRHGWTVLNEHGRPAVTDVDAIGRVRPVLIRDLATALALADELDAQDR